MDYELTTGWQLTGAALLVAFEFILTLKRPALAGAAILILLPTYLLRIRATPLPTNILELLVWAFFAGYIASLLKRRARLPELKNYFWLGVSFLFLGATISAAVNIIGTDTGLKKIILGSWKANVLDPLFFLVAISGLFQKDDARRMLARGYVFSAVGIAAAALLFGLLQKFAVFSGLSALTYDGRLRGFYLSPNHLAMFILPACVMLAGISKYEARNPKHLLSVFILGGALLWTQSLGTILAFGVGVVSVFLLRSSWRRLFTYWLGALLLVVLLTPFFAVHFSSYLIDQGDRSSLASRIIIWQSAEDILKQNWLLGIGPGTFQEHYLALQKNYPPYLEWAAPQPHNLFLAVWLQAGILGLVGFLGLMVAAFRRVLNPSRHTLSPTTIAAASALVAMVLYGFVDTPFWKNDLSLLFILLISTVEGRLEGAA